MSCCGAHAATPPPKSSREWARIALAGAIAAQSMIFGLAVNLSPPDGAARLGLHAILAISAVAVFALAGWPIARAAGAAARRGHIVVEQLFLLGILGAFGASLVATVSGTGHVYYEVVAILVTIFSLGRILAAERRRRALEAAESLGREFESCERVNPDGTRERVSVRSVRAGDLVAVAAGEPIPVDGVIADGAALVDESSLTGEPFPVRRAPGDAVLAGGRAVDGGLHVRVAGSARVLDGLLERVRTAQRRPSRLEREADRIVAWFLPAVVGCALVTFAFWTLRAGGTVGLFNALAVLLVACPCALGLATPLVVWSALADLARRGLVAADGDLVERLAAVRQVVFDKTGTLGERDLELADWSCAPGVTPAELLGGVAALEAASRHPIAGAFRRFAFDRPAQHVRLLPGSGLEGRVGDHCWRVINEGPQPDATHALAVFRDDARVGVVRLRERLRDATPEVLAALDAAEVPWTVLTGDRQARDLPTAETGLSPLDKARRVAELAAAGPVVFVGDGLNDAAAMSEAHVALSVGGSAHLAREAAAGDLLDLRALPYALARCRAARRAIRRNLWFAAAYNLAGITLAAAGVLHPVAAALLMLASSLTVTWRALRPPAAPLPAAPPPGLTAEPQPA